MSDKAHRVCPVECAGSLDSRLRRWVQNPVKILRPYLREGLTVLDFGCGPGFFTLDMARLVGSTGRVIACDLQEGMLQRVRQKVQGAPLEGRITFHQCQSDRLGLSEPVDFVLAFYVIHEVPGHHRLFGEIAQILRPDGRMLVVEPPIHVSRKAFDASVATAERAGLMVVDRPRFFLNKAVILRRR